MNVRRLTQAEQADMQAHAISVDEQRSLGLRVQRGEKKFIAPAAPDRTVQLPMMAPTTGTDLSTAISAVSGTSHDASTAKERAVGYVIRFGAMAGVILILALTATLFFVWVFAHTDVHAGWFDRVLIFFTFLGGGLLLTGWRMNIIDYLFSGAGVERRRLDVLAEMHQAQLDHELTARREALAASLRLLERRDRGDY